MPKTIPLSGGKSFAVVDDEDFDLVSQWTWTCFKSRYATRQVFFSVVENGKRVRKRDTIYMHRYIMMARTGEEVDHIDGNGFDNRKVNLRLCTHLENSRNLSVSHQPNKTSRYKGVNKRGRKFLSRIKVLGKQINLGYFYSEDDAALAYNKAAMEHFGEFARLNEIRQRP